MAILAATVVLSVATTLVMLSLKHLRRARRTPVAATGPQESPANEPKPAAGDAEILTSHDLIAEHDLHQADSR